MYQIKSVIAQENFSIITHSNAASFAIKRVLMKLATVFKSKNKEINLKSLTAYENKLKIKSTLPWTLF